MQTVNTKYENGLLEATCLDSCHECCVFYCKKFIVKVPDRKDFHIQSEAYESLLQAGQAQCDGNTSTEYIREH